MMADRAVEMMRVLLFPFRPLIKGNRNYLKKVFWPNLGVGRSYQILEIPDVFLQFDIRGRLDLEPKSVF